MCKKINIIIFFFTLSQISFCSEIIIKQGNLNNIVDKKSPDIAGIKTSYIFTAEEAKTVTGLNNQIKAIFQEIKNLQPIENQKFRTDALNVNSNSANRTNISEKKRKIIGGKSLYQLRKEGKEKNVILLAPGEISVMNSTVVPSQQDFGAFLIDDFLDMEQAMTVGERIIYYKQKYLNLAKKYLEQVAEKQKRKRD